MVEPPSLKLWRVEKLKIWEGRWLNAGKVPSGSLMEGTGAVPGFVSGYVFPVSIYVGAVAFPASDMDSFE